MAYARFQANAPWFLGGRQSEYWTHVDDLDQAETALHVIAAL
jgi:hypothetical protein